MNVLGMGNALLDIIYQLPADDLLSELNLPKGSMTLIDQRQLNSITKRTAGIESIMVSGGSAANTIHGLNSLGVPTGFIGSVGKDSQGDFYKEEMTNKRIVPYFDHSSTPTGRAMAFVTPDSERTFATYLGAALELTAPFLNKDWFSSWDFFHIEGYLVQNHQLIQTALRLAHEAGCTVSLDLASYNVVEDNSVFLQSVMEPYVDILFANEEEAKAFTGKAPDQAVDKMAESCRIAVVKVGEDGALVKSGDRKLHIPGYAAQLMDTSGAGDIFAAGFLFGQVHGLDLETSSRIGNLLGSTVIEKLGPKIPESTWDLMRKKIADLRKAGG